VLKGGAGRLGLLFLLCVFVSTLVLLDIYADDGRAQAQDQAVQKAQNANPITAFSYRHELEKQVHCNVFIKTFNAYFFGEIFKDFMYTRRTLIILNESF